MSGAGGSLRVNSSSRGGVCYLGLEGTIDESFDPQTLLSKATGKKLIVNLRQISRLSSFGVREWSHAIKKLCQQVEQVFLVECSPAMVNQINMVANFVSTAHVVSVQAPYYCENCGAEAEQTVELTRGRLVSPPDISCSQCGKMMTFDEDPDGYFALPAENLIDAGVMSTGIHGLATHFSDAADSSISSVFEEAGTAVQQRSNYPSLAPVAEALPTPETADEANLWLWLRANRWNVVLGVAILLALFLLGLVVRRNL